MNETTRELLNQVLALPEDQRAVLLEALLESVSEDSGEWEEGALVNELDRRRAEAAGGSAGAVRWEELRDAPPGDAS
jgi:putative addiction module component (TIGR02574 family)